MLSRQKFRSSQLLHAQGSCDRAEHTLVPLVCHTFRNTPLDSARSHWMDRISCRLGDVCVLFSGLFLGTFIQTLCSLLCIARFTGNILVYLIPMLSSQIHLAFSWTRHDIWPSFGIFDLMDMCFGQFVFACHSQFASVERLSKNRDTRDLCWQLDQIHHDSFSQCSSLTEVNSSVETWFQNPPSTVNPVVSHLDHDLRS